MKKNKIELNKLRLGKQIITGLTASKVIGGNTELVISCSDCYTYDCPTTKQCPTLKCGPQTISQNCEKTYFCDTID